MRPNQRMIGSNGKENFLFPLQDMWITQGSYEYTATHNGSYAMDFDGYLDGSFQTHVPFYAPFTCRLVAKWGKSSNYQAVWESVEEVNFIDGSSGYACFAYNHDNAIPYLIYGELKSQGDLIGHTGTYGASNDHIHIEGKKGKYEGYIRNSQGVYMLKNSTWLYNLMGVNNTDLVHDYYVNHIGETVHYNWREFSGIIPPIPIGIKKNKFPWVLYARKLRQKRNVK